MSCSDCKGASAEWQCIAANKEWSAYVDDNLCEPYALGKKCPTNPSIEYILPIHLS